MAYAEADTVKEITQSKIKERSRLKIRSCCLSSHLPEGTVYLFAPHDIQRHRGLAELGGERERERELSHYITFEK